MCTVFEVVDNKLFEFQDKYNSKPFEHTTVLTSLLHNIYQSKQNCVFIRWTIHILYSAK